MCKYCANVAQILCKYCANIVQLVCKYFANIVQILCKYCANIVQILCKYCANIVQILCKYCSNVLECKQDYTMTYKIKQAGAGVVPSSGLARSWSQVGAEVGKKNVWKKFFDWSSGCRRNSSISCFNDSTFCC